MFQSVTIFWTGRVKFRKTYLITAVVGIQYVVLINWINSVEYQFSSEFAFLVYYVNRSWLFFLGKKCVIIMYVFLLDWLLFLTATRKEYVFTSRDWGRWTNFPWWACRGTTNLNFRPGGVFCQLKKHRTKVSIQLKKKLSASSSTQSRGPYYVTTLQWNYNREIKITINSHEKYYSNFNAEDNYRTK